MRSGLQIAKIWGIPIRLHASWFIVFGLLTWSLSRDLVATTSPVLNLVIGLATTLLLFASVLAHELGHSWVAIRDGIPVKGITLFIFGGLAQIEREPRSPLSEFRIAIAGPLTSLLVAGLFGGIFLLERQSAFLAEPSFYLMRINFILALFNLIPGFPLDGGRVLRAAVWAYKKDLRQATRVASITGQVFAYLFIGWGIINLFLGQVSNGLWMIFIGWFLQNAASSAYQQLNLETILRETTVFQAMDREIIKLPGLTPLSWVIEEQMSNNRETVIYVTEYSDVSGILTIQEIMKVPRPQWPYMTINQVMTPLQRIKFLGPEMSLHCGRWRKPAKQPSRFSRASNWLERLHAKMSPASFISACSLGFKLRIQASWRACKPPGSLR
jgi:Zn-dependent protease